MKIEIIRGKNLASLEGEFCLDFTEEPLRSAGLYSISGPTGSGKSTLLKVLGTTEVPDGGEILLNGKSILHLKDKEVSKLRRSQIGFIYQDYSLLPEFTAYENIIFPMENNIFNYTGENAKLMAKRVEALYHYKTKKGNNVFYSGSIDDIGDDNIHHSISNCETCRGSILRYFERERLLFLQHLQYLINK